MAIPIKEKFTLVWLHQKRVWVLDPTPKAEQGRAERRGPFPSLVTAWLKSTVYITVGAIFTF